MLLAKSEKDGRTYTNIRGFNGPVSEKLTNGSDDVTHGGTEVISPQKFTRPPIDPEMKPKEVRKSVKGSAYEKDPVGLAVECFSALISSDDGRMPSTIVKTMDLSILLVKQAQEAFN